MTKTMVMVVNLVRLLILSQLKTMTMMETIKVQTKSKSNKYEKIVINFDNHLLLAIKTLIHYYLKPAMSDDELNLNGMHHVYLTYRF